MHRATAAPSCRSPIDASGRNLISGSVVGSQRQRCCDPAAAPLPLAALPLADPAGPRPVPPPLPPPEPPADPPLAALPLADPAGPRPVPPPLPPPEPPADPPLVRGAPLVVALPANTPFAAEPMRFACGAGRPSPLAPDFVALPLPAGGGALPAPRGGGNALGGVALPAPRGGGALPTPLPTFGVVALPARAPVALPLPTPGVIALPTPAPLPWVGAMPGWFVFSGVGTVEPVGSANTAVNILSSAW